MGVAASDSRPAAGAGGPALGLSQVHPSDLSLPSGTTGQTAGWAPLEAVSSPRQAAAPRSLAPCVQGGGSVTPSLPAEACACCVTSAFGRCGARWWHRCAVHLGRSSWCFLRCGHSCFSAMSGFGGFCRTHHARGLPCPVALSTVCLRFPPAVPRFQGPGGRILSGRFCSAWGCQRLPLAADTRLGSSPRPYTAPLCRDHSSDPSHLLTGFWASPMNSAGISTAGGILLQADHGTSFVPRGLAGSPVCSVQGGCTSFCPAV